MRRIREIERLLANSSNPYYYRLETEPELWNNLANLDSINKSNAQTNT